MQKHKATTFPPRSPHPFVRFATEPAKLGFAGQGRGDVELARRLGGAVKRKQSFFPMRNEGEERLLTDRRQHLTACAEPLNKMLASTGASIDVVFSGRYKFKTRHSMSGIVYLLTNEAMPGLVKIGKTTSDDPQVRMDQLYNTSVPVPFECALAVRVDDTNAVERALHTAFGPQRVNPKREFFKIDPEQAIGMLRIIGSEDVTPTVNDANNFISEVERSASEILRKRRPILKYSEMGIPHGSVLRATQGDEEITVLDDRRVHFRNQTMSLTQATREYLELPYSVAPARYWLYQDRSLHDIYNETYPLDGG